MAGEKIRIEDLTNPVLTQVQQAGIDYADTLDIELSVARVQAEAEQATGLNCWGPDDWKERLGIWFDEMNADDNRTNLGRMILYNDCVRYAKTRLRTNDLLMRHPEIHDVKIERPIIVMGLPRSGTTHLVNLIASDERLRSMPLWEGQEPVPDPAEKPGADGVDPRWHRCNAIWHQMTHEFAPASRRCILWSPIISTKSSSSYFQTSPATTSNGSPVPRNGVTTISRTTRRPTTKARS